MSALTGRVTACYSAKTKRSGHKKTPIASRGDGGCCADETLHILLSSGLLPSAPEFHRFCPQLRSSRALTAGRGIPPRPEEYRQLLYTEMFVEQLNYASGFWTCLHYGCFINWIISMAGTAASDIRNGAIGSHRHRYRNRCDCCASTVAEHSQIEAATSSPVMRILAISFPNLEISGGVGVPAKNRGASGIFLKALRFPTNQMLFAFRIINKNQ
jgi:hypothetical protein